MRTVQAYRHTEVHWGKSQADLMRLLAKHGIRDVRFSVIESLKKVVCEFNYPTKIETKDVLLGVRIAIPLAIGSGRLDDERLKNQAHRALFYYLKTKFEAMSFGLVEFVQEFLPHLTILDKSGRSSTVYQQIGDQLKQGYITGTQGELKLLEGPKPEK